MTSSALAAGASLTSRTSGFTSCRLAAASRVHETVGDQLRVVRLGVVGRAADVRREHDVLHRASGWSVGEVLALEVVEAGAAEVADRSAATSASVSCSTRGRC